MENMRKDGWNVEVCPTVSHGIRGLNLFIPVPPVRPIEANMPHLGVNIGLPTESQSLLTDPLKSAPSWNSSSDYDTNGLFLGQLPGCIPSRHQRFRPSLHRTSIQLWYGRCADNICHGRRVHSTSQTVH